MSDEECARIGLGEPAQIGEDGVHGRGRNKNGVAAAVGSLGPIATTLGAIRGARAIASISARPITRARAVASTITGTIPNAISAARPILPRTKHLLPVAATEIHPI